MSLAPCVLFSVSLQMMDKLKSEQDKLCKWLSSDPDYILNECGDILSRNEFREVENQSDALDKMRMLLKIIIQKGSESCQSFWEILKEHQVHYPQVQQLFHPNTAGKALPVKSLQLLSVSLIIHLSSIKPTLQYSKLNCEYMRNE